MKRDYLLIIAGVIPLLFIVYIFKFFGSDERQKQMDRATLIDSENWKGLEKEQFVMVSGKVSPSQPILDKGFVFFQIEEKIKQKDRSVWTTMKSESSPLEIDISPDVRVKLKMDKDGYTLCGAMVKIIPIEGKDPKKHRILGLTPGTEVTAYGKVQTLDPLEIDVGKSLCAETLLEYKSAVSSKTWGYVLAVLFLSIPSLFLIYLGMFRKSES